jgi:hypothetical protein
MEPTEPKAGNSKNNGFRWLPRAFLVAACLSRVFYISYFFLIIKQVGPLYWDWWQWVFIIPIFIPMVIVSVIAWLKPIGGGIASIIWIPIAWFYIAVLSFGTQSEIPEQALVLESVFLAVGGILSIVWGIWRRKKR